MHVNGEKSDYVKYPNGTTIHGSPGKKIKSKARAGSAGPFITFPISDCRTDYEYHSLGKWGGLVRERVKSLVIVRLDSGYCFHLQGETSLNLNLKTFIITCIHEGKKGFTNLKLVKQPFREILIFPVLTHYLN
ncbi:hypothetical protein AHMF7605_07715 [Adhaeribacter arboris]|uniref:Uncharacterized protein n=1 Tax=Adhaeribacter arboris TaxID=2072846 RepID=A0A2T2YD24_9BACT|nr:hypothetical protein AHMF7605_07715 [Adhaeribacter arboris]